MPASGTARRCPPREGWPSAPAREGRSAPRARPGTARPSFRPRPAPIWALLMDAGRRPAAARPAPRGVPPAAARPLHPLPSRRRRRAARARVLAPAALDGGMIIGTAGHIDHGKSALVTALTGPRHGPARRGAAPRDHHRSQLRAARPRQRGDRGRGGRPGPRGLRAHHGGRRVGRGPGAAGRRGRRGDHAADARAPLGPRASRRAARHSGA